MGQDSNLRSREAEDLQSPSFDRSETHPKNGAGIGTRTLSLMLTKHLLCQLSYAGIRRIRIVITRLLVRRIRMQMTCLSYDKATNVERMMGIEPTHLDWKTSILPLNYIRTAANRIICVMSAI